MPKTSRTLILALGLLTVAGTASAMWWITDMFDQVSKKPQEGTPLTLPKDSVPAEGWDYPVDLPRAELAALLPANPYAGETSGPSFEHGRLMYDTYCAVCHGRTGFGDGPVSMIGKGIPPFPLLGAAADRTFYTDQLLFAQIWVGNGAIMGPYHWAMSPDEVWQVVNYLRSFAAQ